MEDLFDTGSRRFKDEKKKEVSNDKRNAQRAEVRKETRGPVESVQPRVYTGSNELENKMARITTEQNDMISVFAKDVQRHQRGKNIRVTGNTVIRAALDLACEAISNAVDSNDDDFDKLSSEDQIKEFFKRNLSTNH